MKRVLCGISLVAALAGSAYADTVQIDETFRKANQWLHDNNLTVTGSPSGRDDNGAFSQEVLVFCGEAVANPKHESAAQREIMAKRAAVVIAQRAALEYMEGFALVSDTLVREGMGDSDAARSSLKGFLKGAQVVLQDYSEEKGKAVAIIKIGLHGPKSFGSLMYDRLASDANLKKAAALDKPTYTNTPVALEQKYDGLIIDATDQNFQPALINRIFSTKGDVLYDPAKVSQKVLVEQGCGEYTNTVEKAKAALGSRGVKNPLVIKAAGAPARADLQVSDTDALTIYSANQQGNFFSAAKVAFVLQ